MAWTIPDSLRAEIRRVLGYPDMLSSSSITLGYPGYASQYTLFQPYAILEDKLNFLAASDSEAVPIFGASHPSFGSFFTPAGYSIALFSGFAGINVGASIAITVSFPSGADSIAETVTATADDTTQTLATSLAAALTSGSMLAVAVDNTISFFSTQIGEAGNGILIVAVATDPSLTLSDTNAPIVSGALSGGMNPPGPFFLPDGAAQPVYGYLPTIRQLEADLAQSRDNLDTQQAGTFFTRPDEMQARARLLGRYRRELADRFGVPLDPDIVGNRRRGRTRVV